MPNLEHFRRFLGAAAKQYSDEQLQDALSRYAPERPDQSHQAKMLADQWNQLADSGREVSIEEAEHVDDELSNSGWVVAWADGKWSAQPVSKKYYKEDQPTSDGGVIVDGKRFRAGSWVPAEPLAEDVPEDIAKAISSATAKHAEGHEERQQRVANFKFDPEELKKIVAQAGDPGFSEAELVSIDHTYRAIKRHHGKLLPNRIAMMIMHAAKHLEHNPEGTKRQLQACGIMLERALQEDPERKQQEEVGPPEQYGKSTILGGEKAEPKAEPQAAPKAPSEPKSEPKIQSAAVKPAAPKAPKVMSNTVAGTEAPKFRVGRPSSLDNVKKAADLLSTKHLMASPLGGGNRLGHAWYALNQALVHPKESGSFNVGKGGHMQHPDARDALAHHVAEVEADKTINPADKKQFLDYVDYILSQHKPQEFDWRPNEMIPEDHYAKAPLATGASPKAVPAKPTAQPAKPSAGAKPPDKPITPPAPGKKLAAPIAKKASGWQQLKGDLAHVGRTIKNFPKNVTQGIYEGLGGKGQLWKRENWREKPKGEVEMGPLNIPPGSGEFPNNPPVKGQTISRGTSPTQIQRLPRIIEDAKELGFTQRAPETALAPQPRLPASEAGSKSGLSMMPTQSPAPKTQGPGDKLKWTNTESPKTETPSGPNWTHVDRAQPNIGAPTKPAPSTQIGGAQKTGLAGVRPKEPTESTVLDQRNPLERGNDLLKSAREDPNDPEYAESQAKKKRLLEEAARLKNDPQALKEKIEGTQKKLDTGLAGARQAATEKQAAGKERAAQGRQLAELSKPLIRPTEGIKNFPPQELKAPSRAASTAPQHPHGWQTAPTNVGSDQPKTIQKPTGGFGAKPIVEPFPEDQNAIPGVAGKTKITPRVQEGLGAGQFPKTKAQERAVGFKGDQTGERTVNPLTQEPNWEGMNKGAQTAATNRILSPRPIATPRKQEPKAEPPAEDEHRAAIQAAANQIESHSKADAERHNAVLADARRQLGKGGIGLNLRSMRGQDYTKIPGFDDVAKEMGARYPEVFAGHEEDLPGRLWDILTEGKRTPISREDAERAGESWVIKAVEPIKTTLGDEGEPLVMPDFQGSLFGGPEGKHVGQQAPLFPGGMDKSPPKEKPNPDQPMLPGTDEGSFDFGANKFAEAPRGWSEVAGAEKAPREELAPPPEPTTPSMRGLYSQIDSAVAASGHVDPQVREEVANNYKHVGAKILSSPGASQHFQHNLGGIKVHASADELTEALGKFSEKARSFRERGGTISGACVTRGSKREVYIDGPEASVRGNKIRAGSNIAQIAAHENTHVIDGGGYFSKQYDWWMAWKEEIKNGENVLSDYAKDTDHTEGFAEVGRAIYSGAWTSEEFKAKLPKCYEFWRKAGLLPQESGQGGGQPLPDVFEEPIVENGMQADTLKKAEAEPLGAPSGTQLAEGRKLSSKPLERYNLKPGPVGGAKVDPYETFGIKKPREEPKDEAYRDRLINQLVALYPIQPGYNEAMEDIMQNQQPRRESLNIVDALRRRVLHDLREGKIDQHLLSKAKRAAAGK
ncbi:hypothetical protein AYO40_01095 [Planctomycetaceae bacterium SCGC AG-212-D15]|nr:hypothetical protein AYO40_01095 [Planctomycetaceae bacterium SCGC AG-212-D15]